MEIDLHEASDKTVDDVAPQHLTDKPEKARVLVVDDDSGMVHLIKAILAKDGYDILTAGNGKEALEVVHQEHPDLILLDVMMPELDGYGVVRELRATSEFRDLPVIMFTAKRSEEAIVRSFEGGVTDFISKPVAPSVLRSRVRRALLSSE
jgi:OmpR family response regulator RpaB